MVIKKIKSSISGVFGYVPDYVLTNKELEKFVDQCLDVYEGKNIGKNNKAYALRFVLQEKNKTLDDKIINSIMSNLIKEFEKKLNAEIRK